MKFTGQLFKHMNFPVKQHSKFQLTSEGKNTLLFSVEKILLLFCKIFWKKFCYYLPSCTIASRDLKIARQTGGCNVKDEAFLISAKLYPCLWWEVWAGEEAAVCQPSAEICRFAPFVNSLVHSHKGNDPASFRWGWDPPRLLLLSVGSCQVWTAFPLGSLAFLLSPMLQARTPPVNLVGAALSGRACRRWNSRRRWGCRSKTKQNKTKIETT